MNQQTLYSSVLDLAQQAGEAIMQVYRRDDHGVQEKADKSPLTEADLAAHQIIKEGLAQLTPELPQLSEEDTEIPYSGRQHWESFWLIDPLDGTKEFIRRNDEFTVNIALIHNGQPVFGVICLPVSGICYIGGQQMPPVKQVPGQPPQPLKCRSLQQPVKVLASRRHKNDRDLPMLEKLAQHFGPLQIDNYGSSLKMCVIAEGSADLYPRLYPTCEWDTAAAQAILEAAGGLMLSGDDLQPLRYNKPSLLNPDFFAVGDPGFPRELLEIAPTR